MRTGEIIRLRDPVGNLAEFNVYSYRPSWDAFDVRIGPNQKWEGQLPQIVADTSDGQGYCVLVYADNGRESNE